ncbi:MAG: co-chaperone GroES [Patescibacteria group bacterium]
MKILPLSDRVLIKPLLEEVNKTKTGIYIPETVSKEKPEKGKVVAVGRGKYDDGKLEPMSVKVGDIVLFSKYGYDEIKVDGEEYFILKEENILAIIS